MSEFIVEAADLCKSFGKKMVLSHITFSIRRNEYVCIMGRSGSGKTTLLNIVGLIEQPDSGRLVIDGKEGFSGREIRKLRQNFLGYIFQDYLLLSDRSVRDNLAISLYGKKPTDPAAMGEALRKAGLDDSYLDKKVCYLSGGEQQRVSFARMMLKSYKLVLADEPTGNLDHANRDRVIEMFKDLQKNGKTIVCVTHDQEIAASADRVICLENGMVTC